MKGNLTGPVEGGGQHPALSVLLCSDKQEQSLPCGGVNVRLSAADTRSLGSFFLQRGLGFTNKSEIFDNLKLVWAL